MLNAVRSEALMDKHLEAMERSNLSRQNWMDAEEGKAEHRAATKNGDVEKQQPSRRHNLSFTPL